MHSKQKIAFFGPFNTRGGREIEAAFIATTLSDKFEAIIFSTESIAIDNDISDVNPSLNIFCRTKNKLDRYLSYLGYKPKRELRFKSLNSKQEYSLSCAIKSSDVVFIIAQLTSNYMSHIVRLAHELDKDIFFRTTGTIPAIQIESNHFSYLKGVNLFINHSEQNSLIFRKVPDLNYIVIDQCNFNEATTISLVNNEVQQLKKFYTVSRLDANKGINVVIKAFNNLADRKDLELHIIGEGEELDALQAMSKNNNIIFHGYLSHDSMIKLTSQLHCMIVASIEEAGPYSAIEAMSMGNPVISTPVGAMRERFNEEAEMWFPVNDVTALENRILSFAAKTPTEIAANRKRTLERYANNYAAGKIGQSYVDAVVLNLKQ